MQLWHGNPNVRIVEIVETTGKKEFLYTQICKA